MYVEIEISIVCVCMRNIRTSGDKCRRTCDNGSIAVGGLIGGDGDFDMFNELLVGVFRTAGLEPLGVLCAVAMPIRNLVS